MSFQIELRKLNLKARNKVRVLISLTPKDATNRLNAIRKAASPAELAQIERALSAYANLDDPLIPNLFPASPQTYETFHRLDAILLSDQIELTAIHARSNKDRLLSYFSAVAHLNEIILQKDFVCSAELIGELYVSFGYSHHLLRKAMLIRSLAPEGSTFTSIEDLLAACGSGKNNIVVTSLMHCFQEEQDYLSMKRSIMNLPNRGLSNKFTRDVARFAFHPISNDPKELHDQLQSAAQSSLIDAVVYLSVNKSSFDFGADVVLQELFMALQRSSPDIDQIVGLYGAESADAENLFFKHSSAWLENPQILAYRRFLDNFYDAPEASYIRRTPELISEVSAWAGKAKLNELADAERLTAHRHNALGLLEAHGYLTRSALFNYCLHGSDGAEQIDEKSLVKLMGITRDLNKTISVEHASTLAKCCDSQLSKLILYLLIAKKSKNEKDDHLLRRVLQKIAITKFDADLLKVLDGLHERSKEVGNYAYEVFTEEFIAKLFNLIESTSQITGTRAALHRRMGQITGEKVYFDRARTLLIDHQINKVRNELDDNRIYVDVARFHEWFDNEMLGEMSASLSTLELLNFETDAAANSVLVGYLESCYSTFSSNKIFGIASYLGRRIRHGTFKGHLYSNVVVVERSPKYQSFLEGHHVNSLWNEWKLAYQKKIDAIIRDRLHVVSPTKHDGLLNPNFGHPQKQEMLAVCVRNLCEDFALNKSSQGVKQVVTEYCWRFAEVDLKSFGAYLKSQRKTLVNQDLLNVLKSNAPLERTQLAVEFIRDVAKRIDENLTTMQMWFKKPLNVAPRASLPLLYRAVCAEVKQTFLDINCHIEVSEEQDIELMGGAYHVLYDAIYVVVFNAAKHGLPGGAIIPEFGLAFDPIRNKQTLTVVITSMLTPEQIESEVLDRLKVSSADDIENAQIYENRSGIPKLYQLQLADEKFSFATPACSDRKLRISLNYFLEN